MIQKYQKWDKLCELFYENPGKQFTIREIAKKTHIPSATVQRYVKELQKQGLLTKENKANVNTYFKFRKTFFMINKLFTSGLLDYIQETTNPSVIILFGSVRKGEYDKDSDIDIFIETTEEKEIDFTEYEKILDHKIQIFKEKDINNLPEELRTNIINGIKLGGYIHLK